MSVSVIKVDRVALLNKLKEVKKAKETEISEIVRLHEAYKILNEGWLTGAKKHITKLWNNYGNSFSFEVSNEYLDRKPKEPTDPNKYVQYGKQGSISLRERYDLEISELNATITLLELSTDGTVNQAMLKNVAKYLG